MWATFALFIIRFRRSLIAVLAVITVFMAWKAKDVEMTYDFAQVVSPNDPDMVYFQQFKRTFGEDANVLVLGLQDSAVYRLGNFNELRLLTDTLAKVEGVSGVLSATKLPAIRKDTATNRFATVAWPPRRAPTARKSSPEPRAPPRFSWRIRPSGRSDPRYQSTTSNVTAWRGSLTLTVATAFSIFRTSGAPSSAS